MLNVKKLLIINTLIYFPLYSNGSIQKNKKTINNQESSRLVTPAFQNPIHNKDLSTTSSPQYLVRNSGRYYLSGNLSRIANSASDVVLKISANNVSLDMNTKSITPHTQGSQSTGIGIALVKGKSNITIMNGTISGSDSSGTQKLNSGIDFSNSGSGTSNLIKVQDVLIDQCKLTGITGTGIDNLYLENTTTSNCINTGTANISGTRLVSVNNLVINNCNFNNNSTSSGSCEGLRLTDCTNGYISNVNADNNQSTSLSIGIEAGYSSTGCNNLHFENTSMSNNSASNGIAIGLSITDSPLISLENCTANNNYSSATDAASGISIFDILANSNSCKLVNVSANQNHSAGSSSYGIYIESDSNILDNVVTYNNYTSANAAASGIFLSGSSYNSLQNCKATANYNSNTDSSSLANAFGIALDGSANHCLNCEAVNNRASANEAVRAVGIYVVNGEDNKIENCTSSSNNATHTTAAVIATGFEINGDADRTQIVNCNANTNFIGDGTSSGSNARAYGIYLSAKTNGADNSMIRHCNMYNNSVGLSGSGLAFGLYDNNEVASALILGNISSGQGICLSLLNSSFSWGVDGDAPNAVPTANQNYFFRHTGSGEDPKRVIQEISRADYLSLSTAVKKWQNISIY